MTLKEADRQIREILDALPSKRDVKDKLFLLFKIKLIVECLEEPLERRRDKAQSAYAARTQIIPKALKQFLVALDRIEDKHDELGDTDVREQIYNAVHRAFINPLNGYILPSTFGMFSEQGNLLVQSAIQRFLEHPQVLEASKTLREPEDRLNAFQDSNVRTNEETTVCSLIGARNRPVEANFSH
jgi:hypothetical protein